MRRTAVAVSGGDRVGIPPLIVEPGAIVESVTVTAETPLVQSQSAERSFAITTTQIENLPIGHGNFTNMTAFVPGVVSGGNSAGGTRLGGAGQNNIMMDGISAMDTGKSFSVAPCVFTLMTSVGAGTRSARTARGSPARETSNAGPESRDTRS